MARLNINVDDELYKKFKKTCIDANSNMTEVITDFMKRSSDNEAYVKREMDMKIEFLKDLIDSYKKSDNYEHDVCKELFYNYVIGYLGLEGSE